LVIALDDRAPLAGVLAIVGVVTGDGWRWIFGLTIHKRLGIATIGFLGTWRTLGHKPMRVLRTE
jgi:hypothetical protein